MINQLFMYFSLERSFTGTICAANSVLLALNTDKVSKKVFVINVENGTMPIQSNKRTNIKQQHAIYEYRNMLTI